MLNISRSAQCAVSTGLLAPDEVRRMDAQGGREAPARLFPQRRGYATMTSSSILLAEAKDGLPAPRLCNSSSESDGVGRSP